MQTKFKTSFALSVEALKRLREMSERLGISISNVLEIIIRRAKL